MMPESVKAGISYAAVGAACAFLATLISLRVFAALPEQHRDLKERTDKLELRMERYEHDVRAIHMSVARIEVLIRGLE
jgi:hypothetical protein